MRASLIQIAVDPDETVEFPQGAGRFAGTRTAAAPIWWSCRNCGPSEPSPTSPSPSEAEPLNGPTYEVMAKARERRGRLAARGLRRREGRGRHPLQHLARPLPRRRTGRHLPQDPPLRLRQGRGGDDGRGRRTRHRRRCPGLTVGLATCYDLRFPELFRGLVDAGAAGLRHPGRLARPPPRALDAAGPGPRGREPGVRPGLRHGGHPRGGRAGGPQHRRRPVGRGPGRGGRRARRSCGWTSTRRR